MKMHLENSEKKLITNYGEGSVSVDGITYESSIVVCGDRLIENWFSGNTTEMQLDDFADILEMKPEILIFGSGRRHVFPPPRVMAELSQQGISMEVMTTSAACRTYNVLVSEFRDVGAALLPIE